MTTLEQMKKAAADPTVTARYWKKIKRDPDQSCWIWVGAITGRGHGRFWLEAGVVVVAHRFGWLLNAGNDVEELPEVVSHSCDNPLCQNPAHLRASTWSSNRIEYVQRRGTPGSPLNDTRGSSRRAREVRDSSKDGRSESAIQRGLSDLDRYQTTLW